MRGSYCDRSYKFFRVEKKMDLFDSESEEDEGNAGNNKFLQDLKTV